MRAALLPCFAFLLSLAACRPPAPAVDIQRIEDQRIEASQELIGALASGPAAQRARAALAMGRIQSPSYATALAAAVADTDGAIRGLTIALRRR